MEFQTLKKSHKKEIVIGAIAICIIGGALTFATTRAKYKLTESIDLVKGTVNYKVPDFRIVALYTENSSGTYIEASDIPTSGYTLNTDKSVCKVYDGTTSIENAPKDNNVTIEYTNGEINVSHLTKKNTRCYLYFDTIKDTTKPTISSVTTTVTKTEINVTVSASDDKGVTEYWYQLGSNTVVKGTGNTHQFTGLSAGTTYTVKVYVKDAAGNQSDTTTKSVTTEKPTASETILNNITYKTTTPTFSNAATTDEGIYRVSDGMYGGYSYYWRGAVKNNYVKFASKCWRIIRINGDGTIRLIYDGTTCHANGTSTEDNLAVTITVYDLDSDRSESVGWTYSTGSQRTTGGNASDAKSKTDSWFNANITGTNLNKVADGKYCNDRNTASGYSWSSQPSSTFYYAGYDRSGAKSTSSVTPTLSCPTGDVYTLKAGLITMDEVVMAGAKWETTNSNYYLYNGQNYWSMSPYNWYYSNSSNRYDRMFAVHNDGQLNNWIVSAGRPGIRPVINLRADVTFSGGDGTQSNPYEVKSSVIAGG